MNNIKVLQIGEVDWQEIYRIPENLSFLYKKRVEWDEDPDEDEDAEVEKTEVFDLVFWDRDPDTEELELLEEMVKTYCLYVTSTVMLGKKAEEFFRRKRGKRIRRSEIQYFLENEARFFYRKPYGEKFLPQWIGISQNFHGLVQWNGNYSVVLNGAFGEQMRQAAFWKYNIPIFPEQTLDFWLEYERTPEVEIALVITMIPAGAVSEISQRLVFSEQDLQEIVRVTCGEQEQRLFISLEAKGQGELKIIALHDRFSRGDHGYFLPGGERVQTSKREEIFFYFDPADLKPPLNVYFSGYKTAQGFEGYNIMKRLGSPFLLVAEPRLHGGCFYMGSEEYERLLVSQIRKYMKELGFSSEDVVFAGLSMGTYGAMYYGCDIRPHALILGKPLLNIGTVAQNEKHFRPGGFPTSLDVLHYLYQDETELAVRKLNQRFWEKFDRTDWSRSKFIVSYMIEDDYDKDAYRMLLEHLKSGGVRVYGKGLHGRHNDDTRGIVKWFLTQFAKVMEEDF